LLKTNSPFRFYAKRKTNHEWENLLYLIEIVVVLHYYCFVLYLFIIIIPYLRVVVTLGSFVSPWMKNFTNSTFIYYTPSSVFYYFAMSRQKLYYYNTLYDMNLLNSHRQWSPIIIHTNFYDRHLFYINHNNWLHYLLLIMLTLLETNECFRKIKNALIILMKKCMYIYSQLYTPLDGNPKVSLFSWFCVLLCNQLTSTCWFVIFFYIFTRMWKHPYDFPPY